MTQPTSKVLLINDEPLILKEFLKGLNAAARALDNPFGITFIGALTAKEGLQLIERDGDIQIVIVDDKLYAVQEGARRPAARNGSAGQAQRSLQVSALKLVQKITALRPELTVHPDREGEGGPGRRRAVRRGGRRYFYREERDFRGMYRISTRRSPSARARRSTTPCAASAGAKDAWHTPGTPAATRCAAARGSTSSTSSWASTCSTPTCRCRSRRSTR